MRIYPAGATIGWNLQITVLEFFSSGVEIKTENTTLHNVRTCRTRWELQPSFKGLTCDLMLQKSQVGSVSSSLFILFTISSRTFKHTQRQVCASDLSRGEERWHQDYGAVGTGSDNIMISPCYKSNVCSESAYQCPGPWHKWRRRACGSSCCQTRWPHSGWRRSEAGCRSCPGSSAGCRPDTTVHRHPSPSPPCCTRSPSLDPTPPGWRAHLGKDGYDAGVGVEFKTCLSTSTKVFRCFCSYSLIFTGAEDMRQMTDIKCDRGHGSAFDSFQHKTSLSRRWFKYSAT